MLELMNVLNDNFIFKPNSKGVAITEEFRRNIFSCIIRGYCNPIHTLFTFLILKSILF